MSGKENKQLKIVIYDDAQVLHTRMIVCRLKGIGFLCVSTGDGHVLSILLSTYCEQIILSPIAYLAMIFRWWHS